MIELPSDELTPLERAIFDLHHSRYGELGFPGSDEIRVTSRKNSTAGRYVYISHPGRVNLPDGSRGPGMYGQFDVDALDAGASFNFCIEGGKVRYLDITVNGLCPWDQSEQNWVIYDPDTGELPA